MFDIVDGFKAGGCGAISKRHTLRFAKSLLISLVIIMLIHFVSGREQIIALNAGEVGAIIMVFIMHLREYLIDIIRNGETQKIEIIHQILYIVANTLTVRPTFAFLKI